MAQNAPFVLEAIANLVNIGSQEFAAALITTASHISQFAANVRVNKANALALARSVQDYVDVLSDSTSDAALGVSPDIAHALQEFLARLVTVQDELQRRVERSYLSQLLQQERDARVLKQLQNDVKTAFEVFRLSARIESERVLSAAETQDPLWRARLALDAQEQDLKSRIEPDTAQEIYKTLRIPPRPSHFFGRGDEAQAVLRGILVDHPAHVGILGGPGMGKTTLALNVLHDPQVKKRFGINVFFIPCDSAENGSDLLAIVGHTFGMADANRGSLQRRLVAALKDKGDLLIVLDNFESAWDAQEYRSLAEDVLSVLGELSNVALIITMRGAERPQRIAWTKPIMPPLQPLEEIAAKHVFYAISDVPDSETHVEPLLKKLDNIPLAVVLMASLAQFESCESLVSRWEDTKTSMLTRGEHRLSSLDVSISISLDAQRMKNVPSALRVLGLLSFLPDGAMDTDVQLWVKGIPNLSRALSTLLQNTLVTRSPDQRIQVLAPIREYMLQNHPPDDNDREMVFSHYFLLTEQLVEVGMPSTTTVIAAISPELENIEAIIRYCLIRQLYLRPALAATARLGRLMISVGMGPADLIPVAIEAARRRQSELGDLLADLLYVRYGTTIQAGAVDANPQALLEEARDLYAKAGNTNGIIDANRILLSAHLPLDRAIVIAEKMSVLAIGKNDLKRKGQVEFALASRYSRALMKVESKEWYLRAIDSLKATGTPEPHLIGFCLTYVSDITVSEGDVVGGIAMLKEAIPLLRQVNYHVGVGSAEHGLCLVLLDQGHAIEAAEHATLAIAAQRQARHHSHYEGLAWFALIQAQLAASNLPGAMKSFEELSTVVRRCGDSWVHGRARQMQARGEIAMYRGDLEEAVMALQTSVELFSGNPEFQEYRIGVMMSLAEAARQRGDCAYAAQLFVVCASFYRTADKAFSARALAGLARVVDEQEVSELLVRATAQPLLRMGYERELGHILLHSARLAKAAQRPELALHRAGSARGRFKGVEDERGFKLAEEFLESLSTAAHAPTEEWET
ncbi:hypothetical protein BKA62DRAFT_829384 [Auriculariales sp. MPI-PUGE-AT-0066]|nr:hypothetical protein BKA62DRAFT_829384 [Auriculariales sp. MPI-PUGE-AT-0066]